jgi:large subunit ribosomal protein L3
MKGLIGKKVGMTQVYNEDGQVVPVTAVQTGPCTVISVRTEEKDGYNALQLGYGKRKMKNVSKAVATVVKNAGYSETAPELIREIRLDSPAETTAGETLTVSEFETGEHVDVTGYTKGRGFQGVVKRYNFAGGRASHGGDWLRRPGSIGMCEFPAKVYKGRKMPGHMGNTRKTVQSLEIVQVSEDDNVLLIKGAIPGPNGRCVIVKQAIKK